MAVLGVYYAFHVFLNLWVFYLWQITNILYKWVNITTCEISTMYYKLVNYVFSVSYVFIEVPKPEKNEMVTSVK